MDLFTQIEQDKHINNSYHSNKVFNTLSVRGLKDNEEFKTLFGSPPADYWSQDEWNKLNLLNINKELEKDIQTLIKIGQKKWELKVKGLEM
jgi:hypothetical protein